MKIYIMTDLEGVAGILDFDNWCMPESRYYETAKTLLTLEVNAAIAGFMEAGATEIMVADGHGAGGINPSLLDDRAKLMNGWPTGYPLLLDKSYDAVAFVGQHAKAGTELAHIPHTQWFNYIDLSVNGLSIGEFGQFVLCAGELGIPAIFGCGDEAFTREAKALTPGIVAVSVKTGTTPGRGDQLNFQGYRHHGLGAIHPHPAKARELIRQGAKEAARKLKKEGSAGKIVTLKPPYERVTRFRPDGETRPKETIARESHPESIAALFNLPFEEKPIAT